MNAFSQAQRLIALSAVLLFVVASAGMMWRLHTLFAYQQDLRTARALRAQAFNVQLDLETGLRGYTSTGDRRFLQPYAAARANVKPRFDALAASLEGLHAGRAPGLLAAAERANVERWLREVADPVLRPSTTAAERLRVQLAGKAIVDQVRAEDAQLEGLLDDRAARVDQDGVRFLWFSAAAGTLLLVLTVSFLLTVNARQRVLREALDAKAAEYEAEKRVADTLTELFAAQTLPSPWNLGLHAAYVPAEDQARIGGDWYDCFELPDGRLMVTIGDVTGHGLGAAVSMGQARKVLIGAAIQESRPHVVLERANRELMRRDAPIVTALCGFVDPVRHTFVYASAGHPPPVVVRTGSSAEILPYGGLPLGVDRDAEYTSYEIGGLPSALLVLYTDGLIEHKRNAVDGEAHLRGAAVGAWHAHDDGAEHIRSAMLDTRGAHDDVAILTIRYPEAEDGPVRVEAVQNTSLLYGPGSSVPSPESNAPGAVIAPATRDPGQRAGRDERGRRAARPHGAR